MRIDLSQGAYRVLSRADRFPFSKGVSIAGILYELFEENECRAFQWLDESGIALEKYRLHFGFYEGLSDSLLSPISAPPFPMGTYGVPVGYYNTIPVSDQPEPVSGGHLPKINEDDPHQTGGGGLEAGAFTPVVKHERVKDFKPPKADDFTKAVDLSTFPPPASRLPSSSILWYLNEEPVSFSEVSLEVDLALFSVLNRIQKNSSALETSYVPGPGGSVLKVKPNFELGFLEPTFELATEHLLFAVLLADDSLGVGVWLREQGLDPMVIYERIEKLYPGGRRLEAGDWSGVAAPLTDHEFVEDVKSPKIDNSTNLIESSTKNLQPPASGLRSDLLRILDAAANRAREAVRVIEDYVRFVLDDPHLTTQCKTLRHRLSESVAEIPHHKRLLSRNTPNDVGTDIRGEREYVRNSIEDVLASNFSRLQESLRSLEEYGKVFSVSFARDVEQLRYQAYSLQKSIFETGSDETIDAPDDSAAEIGLRPENSPSGAPQVKELTKTPEKSEPIVFEESVPFQEESQSQSEPVEEPTVESRKLKIQQSHLYVLLDCRPTPEDFETLVHALLAAEVDVVQLRDKKADDHLLTERGNLLRKLTSETKTLFIMNDRPDLANTTDADGVHLGQEELDAISEQNPIEEVRKLIGPDKLFGVSTHDMEQVEKALDTENIDYIGVGPVFPSSTKDFAEEKIAGLEFLRNVVPLYERGETPKIPAFAIGGITDENLESVLQTGITRIAVSAAIINSPEPENTARKFKTIISEAGDRRPEA